MSSHKCTKSLYKAFLQASSIRYSGLALSEVAPLELSHDAISRWLRDKCFQPRATWGIAQTYIDTDEPCLLIADDTILSKVYSKKIDLVHYQYSGNAHDVIAGIGLVNMLWHGLEHHNSVPIDYRVYDTDTDGKTKNDHFRDMLSLAKKRGLSPEAVVMDAWYSSLKNLKAIRDHGWVWVTTLRKNRKVNRKESLNNVDIPDDGCRVYLRGYGWITVFKFVAKNGRIDYVTTNQDNPTREWITAMLKARWSIEVYHRELKQTCGIERCQARAGRAQRNHIAMAIATWFDKYRRRLTEAISFYRQDWEMIKAGIAQQISTILAVT